MTLPLAAFRPKAMVFSGFPSWLLKSGSSYAALDIDFVNNLAWNNLALVTISSLLTCTRSSSLGYYTNADGTLVSFLSNVLRYGTNGLLVEEARTNLLLRSQTFDNASWGKATSGVVTCTADQAVAPDGTTTADLVTPNASNGYHTIRQGPTVAGVVYSYTVYVKASGTTKVGLREDFAVGQYATFNCSGAGSVLDKTAAASASIAALANGWYRVTFTPTSVSANQGLGIYVLDSGYTTGSPDSRSYVGDGVSGLYLWGAQMEAGAFATSYIPTISSSATRAADNISFSSLSWLNTSVGTFFGKGTSPTTSAYLLSGVSGVALPREGTASQAIADNGTNTLTATAGSSTWASVSKAALAYDGSGRALCMNNGTVATDANLIGTLSSLYVGSNAAGAGFWDGYIKELAWFNSKLVDSALQALTT